jgi:hypothetical protein
MKKTRTGFSVLEMLLATALALLVLVAAHQRLRGARVATDLTLAPQAELQSATAVLLLDLVQELKESIEVVKPAEGTTLNYAVVRDKLNELLLVYPVLDEAATRSSGRPLYDLYLHRTDPSAQPLATRQRLLIRGVERIAFTSLSSGALQVHINIHRDGRVYSLLTTIRMGNIASEAAL